MRKLLVLAAAAASFTAPASAVPVAFGGHWYDYVQSTVSWQQALAAAAAATPISGFTAHLATVTSAAEDNFVANVLTNNSIWLAGTDEAVEGVWTWAAGPETGQIFFGPGALPGAYSNWNPGEPNNSGTENYLHTNINAGNWNDVYGSYPTSGYVIEWSPNAVAGVPEPATWGMMIGGFALAGAAMRRRKATVRFA